MKKLSILLLALFTVVLCHAINPIKTKSNESVIFGRLVLETKAPIKSEKLEINLLLSPKGKTKIKVDENGFFAVKVPVGYSLVDFVKYGEGGNFQKRLYNECLSITISEANKAYYVGDIYMTWTPTDRDKVTKGFSIGIGMGGRYGGGAVSVPVSESYAPEVDCPEITIKETERTIGQFKNIYPDDNRVIETQFVDLN